MRLKFNPILKPLHYIHYFRINKNTATKYYNADKKELNKRILTFKDFFNLYEDYPDSKFKPIYL